MFCKYCGGDMPANAEVCPHCGAKTVTLRSQKNPRKLPEMVLMLGYVLAVLIPIGGIVLGLMSF